VRPQGPRCVRTVQWIGANTDKTALLGRCTSDLREKVFKLAEKVFLVFEESLHLDIDVVHHPLFPLLISHWLFKRGLLLFSVCLQYFQKLLVRVVLVIGIASLDLVEVLDSMVELSGRGTLDLGLVTHITEHGCNGSSQSLRSG
jgi:hypothetical protein